jgi:methyltransferase (TIGR00027 family)
MREGRPSNTAAMVAAARGAAGVDPIAERLVPRVYVPFARLGPAWSARSSLANMMRLRTIAIDDAVKDAAHDGVEQVVVLGAGLCARGFRIAELSRSVVFEVDHPSTQQYKRRKLQGLTPRARDVRLVGVDFEKDDLAASLERAGHDSTARTTWIWEGVTPYLTPPAIASTLGVVHQRSTEGSVLALSYFEPTGNRARFGFIGLQLGLRILGEPFRGMMSVLAMHRLLHENGFEVKDDATYPELAIRLALPAPRPAVTTRERVLIAIAEPRTPRARPS